MVIDGQMTFPLYQSVIISNKLFLGWRIFASIYLIGIVGGLVSTYYNHYRNERNFQVTQYVLILTTIYLLLGCISMIKCKNSKTVHNVLTTLQNICCRQCCNSHSIDTMEIKFSDFIYS